MSGAGDRTGAEEVAAFLKGMDRTRGPLVRALRAVILDADPRIREGIKWNAPSFRVDEWFATTNLRAKEGVMLVLHTGAKPKASARTGLPIDDPEQLLTWLARDRAVVTFKNRKELTARRPALTAIIRQWVEVV